MKSKKKKNIIIWKQFALNNILPLFGMIVGLSGWFIWVNILAAKFDLATSFDPFLTIGYEGCFILLFILSFIYIIPIKKFLVRIIGYCILILLSHWYSFVAGLIFDPILFCSGPCHPPLEAIRSAKYFGNFYFIITLVNFFLLGITILLFVIRRIQKKK